MRRMLLAAVVISLVAAISTPVQADAKADLEAVIDKAIKARGGADNLAKFKAATFKGKGKFYGLGDGLDYTGDWSVFPPGRSRVVIEFEFNNMKIQRIAVTNGDKGWVKLGEMLEEMDKDALAEEKASAHAQAVTSLIVLKTKGYELSPLGEAKVGDRPTVGIKVAHKDRRDVNLFFDKDSGLLLKSETRVKDVQSGQEFNQETFYADYKEVNGSKHAMKITIKRDGKQFIEAEFSDFKVHDRLGDDLFGKP